MGTNLHSSLQYWQEKTEYSRAAWHEIARFELWKDYDLMFAIDEVEGTERPHIVAFPALGNYALIMADMRTPDEWWPAEASDCYGYRELTLEELPALSAEFGISYRALHGAASALAGSKIRVLFWRT